METEYLKRWRMALGGNAADGTGVTLTVEEQRLDSSLEAVYDSDRRGGLGSSAPKVFVAKDLTAEIILSCRS